MKKRSATYTPHQGGGGKSLSPRYPQTQGRDRPPGRGEGTGTKTRSRGVDTQGLPETEAGPEKRTTPPPQSLHYAEHRARMVYF